RRRCRSPRCCSSPRKRPMNYRRWQDRQNERTERWQREDEAPLLLAESETLKTLKITTEERRWGNPGSGSRYTRHVIVARAAARFEIPCSEPKCQDGGHDITLDVLRGLRERQTKIEGTSVCHGTIGDNPCERVLEYEALATYASRP